MPRIKFVVDYKVKAADGKGPKYAAGQVAEMSADSCLHFTSRGLAVDLPDDPAEPAKAAKDDGDGGDDAGDTTPPPPVVPPVPPPPAQGTQKGGKSAK